MNKTFPHTFHIPVMGLGFTIDSPLKIARFGISSVLSIVEDELLERMREYHCQKEGLLYTPISNERPDHREKRITAYLDLLNYLVKKQMETLKSLDFGAGNDLDKYFELLPDDALLRRNYLEMQSAKGYRKAVLQKELREQIQPGDIDVNIMTKVDKANEDQLGNPLPMEYSDALSALKGFAMSTLDSSVVFSAGMNPRLYSYCEQFDDFFPDHEGRLRKRIILKVSDYRSAIIQGKFLAKKGLWISEFRIESGLNCGGHAFATDGLLMGPILEEFKEKKEQLSEELFFMCNHALIAKGRNFFNKIPRTKLTVQGGVGTFEEHRFLLGYYNLDSVGWGSPFLLVPEATNLDQDTLAQLSTATKDDYYLSYASPLGIPFNNFRKSSSEAQRKQRIEKNRPGSPCYKKFLVSNTEFTEKPICTASRQYQHLKIRQLMEDPAMTQQKREMEIGKVTEKDCLCEGLGAPALLKNNLSPARNLTAVTICPGPNLAYFSGVFSLKEMVGHIYGKRNLLNSLPRPHVFINEFHIYLDYFKKEVADGMETATVKKKKYLTLFKENLQKGAAYYKTLAPIIGSASISYLEKLEEELAATTWASTP